MATFVLFFIALDIKISRPYIGTVDLKYGVWISKFDNVFLTVIVMVENIFDGYGDVEFFLFGGDGDMFFSRR